MVILDPRTAKFFHHMINLGFRINYRLCALELNFQLHGISPSFEPHLVSTYATKLFQNGGYTVWAVHDCVYRLGWSASKNTIWRYKKGMARTFYE